MPTKHPEDREVVWEITASEAINMHIAINARLNQLYEELGTEAVDRAHPSSHVGSLLKLRRDLDNVMLGRASDRIAEAPWKRRST